MERHAILINGDAHSGLSEEHAKNMRVLGDFLGRNGYRVLKLEGEKITREKLSRVVDGMRGKMDGDDELFLYVTGHGSMEEGLECAVVDNGIPVPLRWLEERTRSLKYKERVVWLDGCFSGGALRYFAEDPKTLFVSAGSKDETVGCFLFTPPAFEKGKDLNNDGVITFAERFIAGAENIRSKGGTFSPLYFSGRDYEDNGVGKGKTKPRFSAGVASVSTPEELREKLNALQPGEYAVVDFSASWCGPCQTYKPEFDKMAREDGGRHLWIRAEGERDPWGEWKIAHYPTVKIFHEGNSAGYEVSRRKNPLEEIPFALEDPVARKKRFLENILSQMEDGLVLETAAAAKKLAKWVENGKVLNEDLIEIFDERPGTRVGIIQTLEQVGYSRGERLGQEDWGWEIRLTHAVLKDSDEWVRKAVVEMMPIEKWDAETRQPIAVAGANKKMLVSILFNDSSIHVRGAAARKLVSYSFNTGEAKELVEKIGGGIRSGYFGPLGALELIMKFRNDDPQKVDALLFNFLSHPDWLVRDEAARMVEMFDSVYSRSPDKKQFVSRLREMIYADPVGEVRYAAATALVNGLGDKYHPATHLFVEELKAERDIYLAWAKSLTEREQVLLTLTSFFSGGSKGDFVIEVLRSMGSAAKEAIPELIEEIRLFPRDTGKMWKILEAIVAIDPDGAPEHLKTIWFQSTDMLVDSAVLNMVEMLGYPELLEDFLKKGALDAKAPRGWYRRSVLEALKPLLPKMRAPR